jgi:KUP system potassium uptake protein
MNGQRRLGVLGLAALGVVFGDIGTSPLYAFRQCFQGGSAPAPTPENVLGIASLIFWTIVGVVCIKYATFILNANHQGEGGTLALLGLIYPTAPTQAARQGPLPAIAIVILFGTAALYGDGFITPAISVVSAIEGIDVATPALDNLVVPITVVILLGLFALQPRGTGRIGALFGPVMVAWFVTIAALGALAIVQRPDVLRALDPRFALAFTLHGGMTTVVVLGATVLCVSGVEALYADLGHFGIGPIRLAWYAVAFPALALNYFGQAALTLSSPHALDVSSFYALVPARGLYPMVALATAATIIASQALISGAFSLTQQAVQLGYVSRLAIVHTSREQEGQIYMPFVNFVLAVGCIVLVITFKHSANLADAYGLAVTITMLTTTIAYAALTRTAWKWPWWQTIAVTAFFLMFDGSFLVGNVPKIPTGGWIPLLTAIVVFSVFVTWYNGRRRQARTMRKMMVPVEEFVEELKREPPHERVGTAVFLTAHPDGVPYAHQWLRAHILFDIIVLLTLVYERRPHVPASERISFEELHEGTFYRVTAHYGFMELPSVKDILEQCHRREPRSNFTDAMFYLSESTICPAGHSHKMPHWQRLLFAWMVTNARPIEDVLEIPAERIVKVGVTVPV